MNLLILLLTLLVWCGGTATENNHNLSCLLWIGHKCKCESILHGAIICDEDQAYLHVNYGMDVGQNTTVIALNRYAYHNYSTIPTNLRVYIPIHMPYFNMCKKNNRESFLCEKCLPNHGPSAYSSKCHKCDRSLSSAIALYITVKLFPVAVLFIVILTFRINITQGPMLGYILFCQAHVITAREFPAFYKTLVIHLREDFTNVFLFLSAIWNLDVLEITNLVHPFCISPKLWDLDVLLINFISVLFPLFLVVVTYVFIELHARGCKLVVCCWKPFHHCFVRIHNHWSVSDSIIHAFASLMLLSFASLNYNAYQLLSSVNLYAINSTHSWMRSVLNNHPSMHWYSPRYINYPIVVLLFLFCLGVLPSLLLLLYPIQLFRVQLQRYCTQRMVIRLNTFVEIFQGQFKDGCHGTRDFRMAPGFLCCLVLIGTALCCIPFENRNYFTPVFLFTFIFLAIMIAYIHPCKSSIANLSLTFHYTFMAAAAALVIFWQQNLYMDTSVLVYLFAFVLSFPHIVMCIWICYKIERKLRFLQISLACFNFVFGHSMCKKHIKDTPSLPHRVLNSQEYRELT